jgi:hypothetical protein
VAKIDINKVAEVVKKNQVEPPKLRQIIEDLNALLAAEAEEETPPAIKKQFCILISDPNGELPKTDFTGWALQMAEGESPATLTDRIYRAAYDYNATKKGRLYPAKTVAEAIENVPARFFKEVETWVKTKTPVIMLRTDNTIPRDENAVNRRRQAEAE